jgi:hypothetical protein
MGQKTVPSIREQRERFQQIDAGMRFAGKLIEVQRYTHACNMTGRTLEPLYEIPFTRYL